MSYPATTLSACRKAVESGCVLVTFRLGGHLPQYVRTRRFCGRHSPRGVILAEGGHGYGPYQVVAFRPVDLVRWLLDYPEAE